MTRRRAINSEVAADYTKALQADQSAQLTEIIASFRKAHPDKWKELRLCPLQHGLEDMVRILNG